MLKTYYKVVKFLKNKLPPSLPVTIRRMKTGDNEGYCFKQNGKFHIRISSDLEESKVIDVLLHEWAHTLSWSRKLDKATHEEFEKIVHGPEWGMAYAKVYRLFEKNFTEHK